MAEFSDSITKNQSSSSYGLLCHFFFFHFCFFILFSPHVLSFISFLSPLFITTALLSLLSLSSNSEFSDSKLGFLLSVFQRVSPKDDIFEESGFLEELQAYLDVFQAPPVSEVSEPESFKAPEEADRHMGPLKKDPNVTFHENPIAKPDDDDDGGDEQDKETGRQVAEEKSTETLLQHENNTEMEKEPDVNLPENPDGKHDDDDDDDGDDGDGGGYEHENEAGRPNAEEKSTESLLLHENTTKLEDMFCQKEDREVQESNKAEESKEKSAFTSGSKVTGNSDNNNSSSKIDATSNSDGEYFGTPERNTIWEERKPLSSFLGKEKEWRRTLACKLYEERHSHYYVCESEKMDLLWEAYDDGDDDTEANSNTNSKVQEKCEGNDGDEEEEEEEGMEGKYCCLKALKLSAGKMKLGMRRSNIVKISKVLKGIGLLQHVSKHGKKRV